MKKLSLEKLKKENELLIRENTRLKAILIEVLNASSNVINLIK